MGTNHYLHAPACPHCSQEAEEPIHLGKSSAGWCYSLHVRPDWGIHTLADVRDMITARIGEGWQIKDEYGTPLSMGQWLPIVVARSWRHKRQLDDEWFAQNHAEPGPKGLARHQIDGHHCIGHGDGTWDYIVGDFS